MAVRQIYAYEIPAQLPKSMFKKWFIIIVTMSCGLVLSAQDSGRDTTNKKNSVSKEDDIVEEQIVDQDVQKQIASLEIRKTGVFWTKPDFSN